MRYFVRATMYGTCSQHQGSVFTNFAPALFLNRLRFQCTTKTKSKGILHDKATFIKHTETNREKLWEESRDFSNDQTI